jgi:hypothetical protein
MNHFPPKLDWKNQNSRQSATRLPMRRHRSTRWAQPTAVPTRATSAASPAAFIWINFDRHSLLNLFKKAQGKFLADVDEIRPQYQDSTVGAQAVFTSSLVRDAGPSIGDTIDQIDNLTVTEVGGGKELASPWLLQRGRPQASHVRQSKERGPDIPPGLLRFPWLILHHACSLFVDSEHHALRG